MMIGALRALRLPARYVSGYLRSGADIQEAPKRRTRMGGGVCARIRLG